MSMADAAHVLGISVAQVYALVRRGELPAIKIGGRGQWRVEIQGLEGYIDKAFAATEVFIKQHPYAGDEPADPEGADADPEAANQSTGKAAEGAGVGVDVD